MESVFESKGYKSFLGAALGGARKRTGLRAKAARALGCQSAYLSQVLNGHAHLSLEQSLRVCDFLGLTPDERHMFLLLVQRDRAGTRELRAYFQGQIERLIKDRQVIKNRIGIKEALDPIDQTIYYSSWYYSCIHVLLSMSHTQTGERISQYLGLPIKTVNEALHFLETRGLAERMDGGGFRIGARHIHLGDDAANIQKHHTNWRLQAMTAMDRPHEHDLHYSVVFTLSEQDVPRIRDRLIETIRENLKTVESSPEQVVFCQCLDLFQIKAT